MNSEERLKEQKEIIEEIGRYFDKKGFQPIAGRIMGLMMVMEQEKFTFEEITEELNISKSSASNVLRNLELKGTIEYTTIPGDRKKYYHIKRQHALQMFAEFEEQLNHFKSFFEKILELKIDKESENSLFFKQILKVIFIHQKHLNLVKEEFRKL